MKKNKLLFFSIFIVFLLVFSSCNQTTIKTDKYTSYICYDYHLKCLKVESDKGRAEVTYNDPLTSNEYTEIALFQKIVGETDEQFVFATVQSKLPLGMSDKVILQNPNNYIDIWNDWTVNKIELYYIDGHNPIEQNEPANIASGVVTSTIASECLSEFVTFVKTDNKPEKLSVPNGYVRENMDNDGVGHNYYVRVHFNESDNIVWDAQIYSYFSSEQQDRIIFIDNGNQPDGFASINANYVNISNYRELFDWLSNSINNLNT